MKIYLTNEYELENSRKIINQIRKIFPEVKISFIYNKKEMIEIIKKKKIEKYLDETYSKCQKEEYLNDVINYYSNIKKFQEIY